MWFMWRSVGTDMLVGRTGHLLTSLKLFFDAYFDASDYSY